MSGVGVVLPECRTRWRSRFDCADRAAGRRLVLARHRLLPAQPPDPDRRSSVLATFLNFRDVAAFRGRGQSLQLIRARATASRPRRTSRCVDEQIEKVYGFRPARCALSPPRPSLSRCAAAHAGACTRCCSRACAAAPSTPTSPRASASTSSSATSPRTTATGRGATGLPAGVPGWSRASRRSAGYRPPARRAHAPAAATHHQLVRLAEMRALSWSGTSHATASPAACSTDRRYCDTSARG